MARKKLPSVMQKCAREGCENEFEVKLGAKYQKQYCCPRCAALSTREARKHRRRKRKFAMNIQLEPAKKVFSITDLQSFPVSFESGSGGRFVEICNGILNGDLLLIGA